MTKDAINAMFRQGLADLNSKIVMRAGTWREVWDKQRKVVDALQRLKDIAELVPDEFSNAALNTPSASTANIENLWDSIGESRT